MHFACKENKCAIQKKCAQRHVIATLLQDIQVYTLETITSMVLLYGEPVCAPQTKVLFFKFFFFNGKHIWKVGNIWNLSIVSYDFCTWKYYLKNALSRFSSSSHPTTRMRHRKKMSGFKNYSMRDCKLPLAITWDQECKYVCKIGDRSDFYLILIKATPSDYSTEARHSFRRSCPLLNSPPPPRFLCTCLRWRGDARPGHASRGFSQRVKQH